MPEIKTDSHSGALVFHLTPEEQEVVSMKENLVEMEKKMEAKLKELDSILESAKNGTASTVKKVRKTAEKSE